MYITRAVKIYYRVSDGLLASRYPASEMLNWLPLKLWLSFEGSVNPESGLIVNVSHIKREVNTRLASAEVFCYSIVDILSWFVASLENCFECCSLAKVCLELDEMSFAVSNKRENMLIITRKYELAAAHRLWNDNWDSGRNYSEFGKCANPNGHGHNYLLEVALACDIANDRISIDPADIDQIVNEYVIEQFDHKNLCLDIPAMRGLVPTVENMSIVIWDILNDKFTDARLHNIRIWETGNTYADYSVN